MALFFRDIDAPNTSWRPGSEDPIPVAFGRWKYVAGIYRWFACRPLDGHARSNATFFDAPTVFYTATKGTVKREDFESDDEFRIALKKTAPFPAAWHMLPRGKQALYSRVAPTAYALSFILTLWIGGLHALWSYISWQWDNLAAPAGHFIYWLVTAWW